VCSSDLDTNSHADSLLIDLQVGSVSQFKVTKGGEVELPESAAYNAPSYRLGASNSGLASNGGGTVQHIVSNGTGVMSFKFNAGALLKSSLPLAWSAGDTNGAGDIKLFRDAAAQLALRNGATPQKFSVAFAYTDGSNYERLALSSAGVVVESAGTGAANIDLGLTPAGTGKVKFGTHAAIGAETVTGYIEVKDAGGTTRKLAVVS